MEAGEWAGLNFGGWMLWWKIWENWGFEDGDGRQGYAVLENGSFGSRGPLWAEVLLMLMIM